ncbi:MAG: imidazole glycerol phosphate synthase subunit HisF [Candidatus Micrarchaeota archaeon]
MLAKRIIPCLDVKDGRVVKGKQFASLRYAGDPVKLAKRYYEEGADEIVFLDITATREKRKTIIGVVRRTAKEIFIPLTVGGGIRTLGDMRALLNAGADKISINTAAVENPALVRKAAKKFGSQCVVVAIDAAREMDGKKKKWRVYTRGGTRKTNLDAVEWARKAAGMGAGEILLTSIDSDGRQRGYDLELTRRVSEAIRVPVIASGGAGSLRDIYDAFEIGKADAALLASLVHYNKYNIREIKEYLRKKGIPVRL